MEGLIVVKKMSKAQAREIAIEQLKLVGMAPWANHYPQAFVGRTAAESCAGKSPCNEAADPSSG